MPLQYIGSKKHKRWIPGGASGSICPDWTHMVGDHGFGGVEPEQWERWPATRAQEMLSRSIEHGRQRYASANGIAFCAQLTGSSSWHGYPIPWQRVPTEVQDSLIATGQVSAAEIRQGLRRQKGVNIDRDKKWALTSDDE